MRNLGDQQKPLHFVEFGGGSPLGIVSQIGSSHRGGVAQPRRFGLFALVYTLAGNGQYADERGYQTQLSQGDMIVVFPDLAHTYGQSSGEADWESLYVVFDGPLFRTWLETGVLSPDRPVHHAMPVPYWRNRFSELIDMGGDLSTEATALVRLGKLQLLLCELLAQPASALSTADRIWLARAQTVLRSEPGARPEWQEVAQAMGTSYESFRKRFRALSGQAPGHFHASCLMERACALLVNSDQSIAEVADNLGFCDQFHFSRRFKAHVGCSPSGFRKIRLSSPDGC